MLQESIEEMRNTLPKLNQILVTTRATVADGANQAGDVLWTSWWTKLCTAAIPTIGPRG